MKVATKKVLVFGLLGLFVLLFAMQFVSAQDVFDPIRGWFSNWTDGNLSPNIAKFLFWALVSIVVFAVGSKIPGLDSIFSGNLVWLGAAFSIIVGFLSMAYITPEEVFALMTTYTALGFVLGGALPFIILFYFTIMLAVGSESEGATKRYMTKLFAGGLWVLFTGFLVLKFFIPSSTEPIENNTYYYLTAALAILGALCTISIGWMFRKIWKELIDEKHQKAGEVVDDATTNEKQQAGMQNIMGSVVGRG